MPTAEHQKDCWAWPQDLVIDMETEGKALLDLGLNFEVKSLKGTMTIASATGLCVPPDAKVEKIIIQVPHIGLLSIDEVCVLENQCTDSLQSYLDRGWRILCVCPPNAQRRPDYIIGRTKEN